MTMMLLSLGDDCLMILGRKRNTRNIELFLYWPQSGARKRVTCHAIKRVVIVNLAIYMLWPTSLFHLTLAFSVRDCLSLEKHHKNKNKVKEMFYNDVRELWSIRVYST